MAHRPVGSGSSISFIVGSASTSESFSVYSDTLRVVAVGGGVHIGIGTEPIASSSDYYVANGVPATLSITLASNKVVGVTTGTETIIDFDPGTGSPFEVGDYVTLTSETQSFYNFTHKPVISVDHSSGVGGYYSTRITVSNDSSGITTAFSGSAELRKSLKLGAYGAGSGVLYYQQVQISGDA